MRFLILLLVALSACDCRAQALPDITGNWQGRQSRDQPTQAILLKIARTGSGDWRAILYRDASPQFPRSATAPASSITFVDSILQISVDSLQLRYSGKLSADGNTISGTLFYADGENLPMDLHRTFPAKPITVQELELLLTQLRGRSDVNSASMLHGVRLTQQLNTATLSRFVSTMPGPQSIEALHILADESAFLEPPASQIPSLTEPNPATQRAIVARAVDYVATTLHRQPNFYATRITTTYRRNLWKEPAARKVKKTSSIVVYRNGNEERDARDASSIQGLTTSGEFGPILGTAMLDAAKGNLTWSRWQEGQESPFAVFRYVVTAKQSHYEVDGEATGYVGEVGIDPSSGAIQRLVFRADMPTDGKLVTADIAVDYGEILLGGKTYICPMHGIALSHGFELMWLNEVSFNQYHLFGTRIRILPAPLPDQQ
jgi:hypothetical protein